MTGHIERQAGCSPFFSKAFNVTKEVVKEVCLKGTIMGGTGYLSGHVFRYFFSPLFNPAAAAISCAAVPLVAIPIATLAYVILKSESVAIAIGLISGLCLAVPIACWAGYSITVYPFACVLALSILPGQAILSTL